MVSAAGRLTTHDEDLVQHERHALGGRQALEHRAMPPTAA
jgi:hypothetical protein